jgi:hypothetical protein
VDKRFWNRTHHCGSDYRSSNCVVPVNEDAVVGFSTSSNYRK